jgi:CubicO group peptidase (beta-lactamase class C family)
MNRAHILILAAALLVLRGAWGSPALGQAPAGGAVDPLAEPFLLPGRGEGIDAFLKSRVATGFSGSVFVYKDGLILLHQAYGLADRERGIPCTVGTLYPVGSLEREFLMAAILRLEMDGRLAIDPSMRKMLEDAKRAPADGQIDRRLTAIIEEASGQTCRATIGERLLSPAHMDRTTFAVGIAAGDSLSTKGYLTPRRTLRWIERFPWLYGPLESSLKKTAATLRPRPSGGEGAPGLGVTGMLTTAGDLFRWELALLGTRMLSDDAKARLRSWTGPADRGESGESRSYGVCEGYQCAVLRDERRHLLVVVAMNNDLGWGGPILEGIKSRIEGGRDRWLTFAVLAVCVSALLLVLGVTQRGKRGSFGRRSRPNPFPF